MMFYVLLLAHLLGDYLFQFGFIARWKARSLLGVAAHGGIVTITTLACVGLTAPSWWPYALLIGASHTLLDIVRARLLRPVSTARDWAFYLLDQLAHLLVIRLVVLWGNTLNPEELAQPSGLIGNPRLLALLVGYMLLLQPAWVFLRFATRGVWGPDAAPCLEEGEKYGPMIERVLIATCILTGRIYLAPPALFLRRLIPIRVGGTGTLARPIGHWAETAMSTLLAIAIGLMMRRIVW